jgi:HlyD family secretion protein
MAPTRKRSRLTLSLAALFVIAAGLAAAFWPRPELVDLGEVTQGPMRVTIDEEGRTQVAEPYVVSTPVAGRLQRVEVDPGERVVQGETIVAHMRPANPAALDVRTREQARAAVQAAEAALRVAEADRAAAVASRDLALQELARAQRLAQEDIVSPAALERAEQNRRVAQAAVETAEAAIAMREAELANARARLIGFEDDGLAAALDATAPDDIPVRAPADGRILRVFQQSETTLPAGAPIMEIGDIEGGLEVVVELLSPDAVQVAPGDPVRIEDWGGPEALQGEVARIDPYAQTRVSALGVEEQRVPVTVALSCPPERRCGLGHGYRVEARIVVWQREDALRVPVSALFRHGEGRAVFVAEAGRAVLRPVEIGRSNGVEAEALSGLRAGESVVLYPSEAVEDGTAIAERVLE